MSCPRCASRDDGVWVVVGFYPFAVLGIYEREDDARQMCEDEGWDDYSAVKVTFWKFGKLEGVQSE